MQASINFELIYASTDQINIINNLMQFYIYDFSEYTGHDVDEDGFYKTYPGLDEYRKEENDHFPYIIKKDKKYIGFALVRKNKPGEEYFSIVEFFIMKKYRRSGIGKAVAKQLFTLYKGKWQVHQRENNILAQTFWRNIISEYTKGDFAERLENKRIVQNFKS